MSTSRLFAISLAVLLCPLLNSPLQAQWPRYSVTYLGEGEPWDLNDSTVVLAQSMTGTGGSKIWKDGVWRSLPSLLDGSVGMRINNAVQIAGDSYDVARNIIRATCWPNTSTVVDLGTLPGTNNSRTFDINSQGVIVGVCWFDTNHTTDRYQAFTYSGTIAPLPPWGAPTGQYGMGINDSGDVVTYQFQPFMTVLYRGGSVTGVIPDFAGYAINNRKVIAGENTITWEPAYWSEGTIVSLPNPPGGSTITDINDVGTMVGYRKSNVRGLIWKDGELRILEELTLQSCVIEVARAINKKGEILCRGHLLPAGTTGVLLLTPVGKVTAPLAGATWIAGEEDTIRWTEIEKGVTLTVELSTDSGGTYRELVSHIPADSGKCGAHIPKDVLSTKCLIRLRDPNTLSDLGQSEVFKIKPYIITRKDASNGNLIAYDIATDRWGFGNTRAEMFPSTWYKQFNYRGLDPFTNQTYPEVGFRYAVSADFPDWVSFVSAFTTNACYWSLTLALYSPTALAYWNSIRGGWGGSCFGIATSNALAFTQREPFQSHYREFPIFEQPIEVVSAPGTMATVNELWTHQDGNPHLKSWQWDYSNKKPGETLAELKTMFGDEDVKVRVLDFWSNSGSGGHAVLPFKLERVDGLPSTFKLRVYDSSYPNDTTAHFLIDSAANGGQASWVNSNWPGWGGALHLILADDLSSYLTPPTLPKLGGKTNAFVLDSTEVHFYTRAADSVVIRDQLGNGTGYAGDTVMTGIPGSTPLIMLNGSESPPYGYIVPQGSYSLLTSGFADSVSRVTMRTANRTLVVERRSALPRENDRFFYDGGVSIANPDTAMKMVSLLSIVKRASDERVFAVQSLSLAQGDSMRMANPDEERLKISSTGTGKTYDLELNLVNELRQEVFTRKGVSVEPGSSHLLIPDWTRLDGSRLMILVDRGDDGTVDDTLRLQDEVMGIEEHGALIPTGHQLCQNYPNPFNPSTIIRYGLPHKSTVQLAVFNTLGQEVATLVDGGQEAGFHEVKFDASGLSSGVYFYRLTAGSYVQTRKLLLLR